MSEAYWSEGIRRSLGAAFLSHIDILDTPPEEELASYQGRPVDFCRDWLGVRLWIKQREIIEDFATSNLVSVRSCHGAGKTRVAGCCALYALYCYKGSVIVTTAPCYDDQTEILTENGWSFLSELRPGERVAQLGPSNRLEFVEPDGWVKYPFSGDLITIQNQLVDLAITPDHRMYFRTEHDKSFRVRTAQEIEGQWIRLDRSASWEGIESGESLAFLEFFGFWTAEGCAEYSPVKRKYRVTVTQSKNLDYVEALLIRCGLWESSKRYAKSDGGFNFTIHSKDLARKFVGIGGARAKYVPDWIKNSTPEEISAFLDGFRAGDGCVDQNGSEVLFTSSRRLADDLQELVMKVGGVANVGERTPADDGSTFSTNTKYVVRVWHRRGQNPSVKPQHWGRKPYTGHVYCVSVPSGIVMVRRNGKPVWCGNTWDQVEEQLWREIAELFHGARRPLPGKLTKTQLDVGPKWFAIGRSTNSPERFAGFHASPIVEEQDWNLSDEEFWSRKTEDLKPGGMMVGIFDEASGIAEDIYEASRGFRTTPHSKALMIGNPTRKVGSFFLSQQDPKPEELEGLTQEQIHAVTYRRHHISAFDVVRHAPILMDSNWIESMRIECGGEDTPAYKVRVLGEFADESPTCMFPLWALERSVSHTTDLLGNPLIGLERDDEGRWIHPLIIGIDVGAQGEGETVAYSVRGDYATDMAAWHEADTTITTDRLATLIRESGAQAARIDISGVGKGVYDALKRLNLPCAIIGVDFGSSATDVVLNGKTVRRYRRKREEMYWNLSEVFLAGKISGIRDMKTRNQLSPIQYKLDDKDTICLPTKKEMLKMGHKSPDRAEGLLLARGYRGSVGDVKSFAKPDDAPGFCGEEARISMGSASPIRSGFRRARW